MKPDPKVWRKLEPGELTQAGDHFVRRKLGSMLEVHRVQLGELSETFKVKIYRRRKQ